MEAVRQGGERVSQRVLKDTRVVFASICCLKRLLNTLDSCSEGGGVTEGGADFVISKFSLDQVLRKPTALLDALTLYLFIVHNIDWYSSNWARTSNLTTEEKSEVKVFGEKNKDHDEQVSKVIKDLRQRTDNFVQKVQKFISRQQILYRWYLHTASSSPGIRGSQAVTTSDHEASTFCLDSNQFSSIFWRKRLLRAFFTNSSLVISPSPSESTAFLSMCVVLQ